MKTPPKLLAGLIGSGIQGSSSPQIHEDEAQALGLALTYRIIDFAAPKREPAFLESMLLAAESLGFSGLNITHPYKEDAFKLVDTLSEDAKNIGSINTIILREGKRHGDNTDWAGFAGNFKANLPDVKLDKVALVGTGGAGLAVAYAMLKMGAKELQLYDSNLEKANQLAAHLKVSFPQHTVGVAESAAKALANANGLINATPIGMLGVPGMPVAVNLLHPALWVADIIYFPLETDLLKAAKSAGCKTVGGGGMAVRQAAYSFRQFFDVEPNEERMLANFVAKQTTSS